MSSRSRSSSASSASSASSSACEAPSSVHSASASGDSHGDAVIALELAGASEESVDSVLAAELACAPHYCPIEVLYAERELLGTVFCYLDDTSLQACWSVCGEWRQTLLKSRVIHERSQHVQRVARQRDLVRQREALLEARARRARLLKPCRVLVALPASFAAVVVMLVAFGAACVAWCLATCMWPLNTYMYRSIRQWWAWACTARVWPPWCSHGRASSCLGYEPPLPPLEPLEGPPQPLHMLYADAESVSWSSSMEVDV